MPGHDVPVECGDAPGADGVLAAELRGYNEAVVTGRNHPVLRGAASRLEDILARPRIGLAMLPSHNRPNLFGCD